MQTKIVKTIQQKNIKNQSRNLFRKICKHFSSEYVKNVGKKDLHKVV